eukprot:31457-Pelagococcus_subviridis.AAC.16
MAAMTVFTTVRSRSHRTRAIASRPRAATRPALARAAGAGFFSSSARQRGRRKRFADDDGAAARRAAVPRPRASRASPRPIRGTRRALAPPAPRSIAARLERATTDAPEPSNSKQTGAVLQGQPRPQGPRRPQGVLQGVRRRVHGVRQQEGGRDRARRGDRDRPGFPRQGGPHVGPPRALRGEQGAQRQEARADVLRELRAVPHGDGRRVRVPEELLRLRDRVQQRRRRVPLRRQGHRVRGDARRQGVRVQGPRVLPPGVRPVNVRVVPSSKVAEEARPTY